VVSSLRGRDFDQMVNRQVLAHLRGHIMEQVSQQLKASPKNTP